MSFPKKSEPRAKTAALSENRSPPLTPQNKTALLAEAEASGWIRFEQKVKSVKAI